MKLADLQAAVVAFGAISICFTIAFMIMSCINCSIEQIQFRGTIIIGSLSVSILSLIIVGIITLQQKWKKD